MCIIIHKAMSTFNPESQPLKYLLQINLSTSLYSLRKEFGEEKMTSTVVEDGKSSSSQRLVKAVMAIIGVAALVVLSVISMTNTPLKLTSEVNRRLSTSASEGVIEKTWEDRLFARSSEVVVEGVTTARRLQGTTYGASQLQSLVRPLDRFEKFHRVLSLAEKAQPLPFTLTHNPRSFPTVRTHNAIISIALSETYYHKDAMNFVGTARQAGFVGDIVVVVLPTARKDFVEALIQYNATIFTLDGATCTGKSDIRCTLPASSSGATLLSNGGTNEIPVTLLRFFLYQSIVHANYNGNVLVMLSDFRDVIFQSNPFRSKHIHSVLERDDQIMVFNEHHPNRVLNRCAQHIHLVRTCYGDDMLRRFGAQTISSSGVVIGQRNALLTYVSHWFIRMFVYPTRSFSLSS